MQDADSGPKQAPFLEITMVIFCYCFSSEDMQLLLLNYREDLITAKIAKVKDLFYNSRSFLLPFFFFWRHVF